MKNYTFVICLILIAGFYACYLFLEKMASKEENPPQISIPAESIQISVNDDESQILEGITAYDKEDGVLTDQIMIKSISPFNNQGQRVVTLVVFDSDDQMSEANLTISYTDYTPPQIKLAGSLTNYYYPSETELKKLASAYSSLDGDISSRISVYFDTNNTTVTFSVADSTGTSVSETYGWTWITTNTSYTIQLTEYAIDLAVGSYFNAYDYISTIYYGKVELSYLTREVIVDTNLDINTPGSYEVLYRIDRAGENGVAKMFVNVVGVEG